MPAFRRDDPCCPPMGIRLNRRDAKTPRGHDSITRLTPDLSTGTLKLITPAPKHDALLLQRQARLLPNHLSLNLVSLLGELGVLAVRLTACILV